MSSLGLGGRFTLNRMDCLDRLYIYCRFIQVHYWRYKFRHLGKRSLVSLGFLLLGTSTTWKVVQIHSSGYRLSFSLPSLDGSFLDDWSHCSILVPTGYVFLPIFSHGNYSCDKEN